MVFYELATQAVQSDVKRSCINDFSLAHAANLLINSWIQAISNLALKNFHYSSKPSLYFHLNWTTLLQALRHHQKRVHRVQKHWRHLLCSMGEVSCVQRHPDCNKPTLHWLRP